MTRDEERTISRSVGMGVLDEEHSEVHRRYAVLDAALKDARSTERSMTAAARLVEIILLHFVHESHFLEKISLPSLAAQRASEMEIMAEVCKIEKRLERGEFTAAEALRGLCREWIYQHLYAQSEGFELAGMEAARQPGRIPA